MNQQKKYFAIFKALITIIALSNGILLFLFHYELPFPKERKEVFQPLSNSKKNTQENTPYSIKVESEPLVYDGTVELNLLTDVSLISSEGEPPESEIFTHIKAGKTLSEKVIEYSADTDQGQIHAQRVLKLEDYEGPSLTLPDELPAVDESELDSILEHMPEDGSFYADDGFGNDITSAVSASYSYNEGSSKIIHYIFTVKNLFNDSVSAEASLTVNGLKPVLILSNSSVMINLNTFFNPLDYVKSAAGPDGSSLFHRIHIDGEVNTSEPGIYELTYTVSTEDKYTSVPKILTVTVR